MQYKKGTFVVVPNLKHLRGRPTEYLTVFFWLCAYSNEGGNCFPSRKQLGRDCGLTDRTIDKYVAMLEEDGLIKKKKRKKKGTNSYMSNLYQILLPTKIANLRGVGEENTVDGVSGAGSPSVRNIPITIPSINNTNLTIPSEKDKPFSYKEEFKKLKNSKWKPNKIFALYLSKKELNFDNLKKLELEKKINLRALVKLDAYSGKEIDKAMDYCKKNYYDKPWNCHTVVKIIGQVVNQK